MARVTLRAARSSHSATFLLGVPCPPLSDNVPPSPSDSGKGSSGSDQPPGRSRATGPPSHPTTTAPANLLANLFTMHLPHPIYRATNSVGQKVKGHPGGDRVSEPGHPFTLSLANSHSYFPAFGRHSISVNDFFAAL
jgi:hypothetical protein